MTDFTMGLLSLQDLILEKGVPESRRSGGFPQRLATGNWYTENRMNCLLAH